MDNKQNNVYQVPSSQSGEVFSATSTPVDVELSQAEVNQQFSQIARKEVLDAFNRMTRDLEMAAEGLEVEQTQPIEIFSPNPIIVELLQIGNEVIQGRTQHHENLMVPGLLGRILGRKNS
jgi:hypothetical protein